MRDLPHELVAAFQATLTETREATLLLHVIDASDPHHDDRRRQVETVLEDIGAAEVPCLPVYNKIDKAPVADFVAKPVGLGKVLRFGRDGQRPRGAARGDSRPGQR